MERTNIDGTIRALVTSAPRHIGCVWIGDEEPTDPDVRVWIRPSGKTGIETYINDYQPYWRILNIGADYINAFTSIDMSSEDVAPEVELIKPNGTAVSGLVYVMFPFPMKTVVTVGTTDRSYDVRAVNGNGTTPVVGETFRFYSPDGDEVGDKLPAFARLHLMGMIADVPEAPSIEADTSGAADAATAIAESYVNADIPFVYGKNWTYSGADSQVLIGESTHVSGLKGGRMECDTFVDMILRGISYENSPYAENKAAVDADPFVPVMLPFEDMADYENPDSLTWVSWLLANGKLYNNPYMTGSHGGAVRWAQDIAWFMWSINDGEHACIFSDKTEARNGDFAFFKKADRETFDNISHVAYIGEDDGELYVYEVTVETAEHPTAVYKTKLSEFSREIAYFARLDYSAMTEGE